MRWGLIGYEENEERKEYPRQQKQKKQQQNEENKENQPPPSLPPSSSSSSSPPPLPPPPLPHPPPPPPEAHEVRLRNININVNISNYLCNTHAKLQFRNDTDKQLHLVYRMPVPAQANAILYSIQAAIDGSEPMELKCVSNKNKNITPSILEDRTVYLSKQDAHTHAHAHALDVFSSEVLQLHIGKVLPNADIELNLKLVSQLPLNRYCMKWNKVKKEKYNHREDAVINYELLNMLHPRYSCDANAKGTAECLDEENANLWRVSHPYEFNITTRVEGSYKISDIFSYTEQYLRIIYKNDSTVAEITTSDRFIPDHNWNINIEYAHSYISHMICDKRLPEEKEEEEKEEGMMIYTIMWPLV